MNWSGAAPCQCHTPASVTTVCPARTSSTGPLRSWTTAHALGHVQRLALRVAVPGRPGTGSEVHAPQGEPATAGEVGEPDHPGEPLRGPGYRLGLLMDDGHGQLLAPDRCPHVPGTPAHLPCATRPTLSAQSATPFSRPAAADRVRGGDEQENPGAPGAQPAMTSVNQCRRGRGG